MSDKRPFRGEIYNMGCDFEIEALFIKNWAEIKKLLYKKLSLAVLRGRK